MVKKGTKEQLEELAPEERVAAVIDAMDDIKAEDIIWMDLRNISGSSFDFFVICHAESTTQVSAIGEKIKEKMLTVCHQKPWHAEGFANAEWILLDYGDVVAHVFQTEVRAHYQLEKLWADAEIRHDSPIKKTAKKNDHGTKTGTTAKKTTAKSTTTRKKQS